MGSLFTQLSDLVTPERMEFFTSWEWSFSLEVIDGLVGPGDGYPYRMTGYDLVTGDTLADGGTAIQRPKYIRINAGGLVTKQEYTSVNTVDSMKIQSRNDAGIMCVCKIGPVGITPNAENLSKARSGDLQRFLAEQAVLETRLYIQHMLLSATMGALAAVTATGHTLNKYNSAANNNMMPNYLNSALGLMGDMQRRISWWVFRSEQLTDLIGDNIGRAYSGVGDVVLYGGMPTTLGRPFAVVNDSALFLSGGGVAGLDEFYALGLGPDFMQVDMVQPLMWYEPYQPLDFEQVVMKLRGDLRFVISGNGFKWLQTTTNPADTDLATSGNWTYQVSSSKEVHAVNIFTNASLTSAA